MFPSSRPESHELSGRLFLLGASDCTSGPPCSKIMGRMIHGVLRLGIPLAACGLIGYGFASRAGSRSVDPPATTSDDHGLGASLGPSPIASVISPHTAGAAWPGLLGPAQNSTSPEVDLALDWLADGPPAKWRIAVGSGYSSPIVEGELVVLCHRLGDESHIDGIDRETGARKWRFSTPTDYQCPVAYSNGPYSTPIVGDQRVFAWSAEGQMHCLELESGRVLWQRAVTTEYQTPAGTFPAAASPLIEGDNLILNVGGAVAGSGIVALDTQTGQTNWTATNDAAGYATPVAATIYGHRHVFVFTADGLISINPVDGSLRWSVPFCAKNRQLGKLNASSPVVEGDIVAVSAYSAGCLALRILPDGNFEELWRGGPRVLDSQYTNLTARNGVLYGYTSLQRSFRALDLKTGEILWTWPSDLGRGAMFVAVGDQFIMLGELGHLAVLDTRDRQCRLRSTSKEPVLAGPVYSAPALASGLLYARNERELVCFDLRQPTAKR